MTLFSHLKYVSLRNVFACALAGTLVFEVMTSVEAASETPTKRIEIPEEKQTVTETGDESDSAIPTDNLPVPGEMVKEEDNEGSDGNADLTTPSKEPPPPIMRDLSKLPPAVRQTRQNILDAAATGDINKLRFLIGSGESATELSIGGIEGDPIDHLKASSGDDAGQEMLAILTEILEAGYVHLDAGKEEEIYMWPYFFAWPLEKLTPQMRVELFRILTAGDLLDSTEAGGYSFYRTGIKPDGTWSFFVSGH